MWGATLAAKVGLGIQEWGTRTGAGVKGVMGFWGRGEACPTGVLESSTQGWGLISALSIQLCYSL